MPIVTNNDLATIPGTAWDAVRGAQIRKDLDKLNSDLQINPFIPRPAFTTIPRETGIYFLGQGSIIPGYKDNNGVQITDPVGIMIIIRDFKILGEHLYAFYDRRRSVNFKISIGNSEISDDTTWRTILLS